MRVLIIDDDEYKYRDIKDSLERVFEGLIIEWKKSRNSGLIEIMKHMGRNAQGEPYDIIVCDNYMPLYEDEYELEPFGAEIVNEIRRRYNKTSPIIIMCSSDNVEDCEYDYIIKYDSSVLLDPKFRIIKDDILERKGPKSPAEQFMDNFMAKLHNDELRKDTCPQSDDGFAFTSENIEMKLSSYQSVISSPIFKEVTSEPPKQLLKVIKDDE